MSTRTVQNGSTRQLVWLAGAVGAVVGIASLAYRRRERNRWDTAKERVGQFVKNATEEVRPWMGVAAGTAAAGATIAVYARGRKKSNWQRTLSRLVTSYRRPDKNWGLGRALLRARQSV